MDLPKTYITTERLLLIPISEKYAQEIFQEFIPEVTKYMFPTTPKAINETYEYIRSATLKMQKGEEFVVTILDKKTGEFLGGGGAHNLHTSTPELGIWIKKSAQNKAYGKETLVALKEWVDNHVSYR